VANDGKRFILNYKKYGFYHYLKHLLQSPMCRGLAGIDFPTVLTWFSRLYEVRRRFFQYVGADPQKSLSQNSNYTTEGVIEGGRAVVLRMNALEVFDAELARFEDRLEKLIRRWKEPRKRSGMR
jgi:hypothetical protein